MKSALWLGLCVASAVGALSCGSSDVPAPVPDAGGNDMGIGEDSGPATDTLAEEDTSQVPDVSTACPERYFEEEL